MEKNGSVWPCDRCGHLLLTAGPPFDFAGAAPLFGIIIVFLLGHLVHKKTGRQQKGCT